MTKLLLAFGCLALLAVGGCNDDVNGNGEKERFVRQDRLDNPIVNTKAVDQAVHTEAMTGMRKIADQVKMTVAKGANPKTLYPSISGTLSESKLSKIGLSESDIKGNYYKASDYSVVIVGNEMTITAAQIGSRGRVEPQSFRVP